MQSVSTKPMMVNWNVMGNTLGFKIWMHLNKLNFQALVLDSFCSLTSIILSICSFLRYFHSQRKMDFVFILSVSPGFKQTCGYCYLCPMTLRTCALLHYQAKRPLGLLLFCHFGSTIAKNFLYILFPLQEPNIFPTMSCSDLAVFSLCCRCVFLCTYLSHHCPVVLFAVSSMGLRCLWRQSTSSSLWRCSSRCTLLKHCPFSMHR